MNCCRVCYSKINIKNGDDCMLRTALNFNGRDKEAHTFYANVFNYEIKGENADIWYYPETGLVGFALVDIYNTTLAMADIDFDNDDYAGFSLAINLTDEAELRRVWDALNIENAQVIKALGKQPWSECCGYLKDKFGVTWQFNLD